MGRSFDIRQSHIVKGAATLLMLWHHCFLTGRFERFTISFAPFSASQVSNMATFFKICVSLFAFVSGYGLYLSFNKWRSDHPGRVCTRWLWQRYVRSFSDYWLVIVLAWIICGLIDGRPQTVYVVRSRIAGVLYAVFDFFGVGKLFGSPILVAEWWYMSAALFYIVMIPFLFSLLNRVGSIACLALGCFLPRIALDYPGGTNPLTFLPAFCVGAVFAKNDLFARLDRFGRAHSPALMPAFFVFLSIICFFIDRRLAYVDFWPIKWGLLPAVYVLCIYYSLARIPIVADALAYLGKKSVFIYLTHPLLLYTYARRLIMARGHFLIILAVLLAVSLLTSYVLEAFKALVHYDRFCVKLENLSLSSIFESESR